MLGGLDGPISEDDLCPGPPDRGQRLEDCPLAVNPAVRRGGLQHRVLAADLIRRHGHVDRVGIRAPIGVCDGHRQGERPGEGVGVRPDDPELADEGKGG